MTRRVLLIDDEKDFTELTGTLLSFHDLEVDTVNDPRQVDDLIAQKTYDVIVTDLMMPARDGFELVRLFRRDERLKEVPIVVLSAKILNEEERKFLFQQKVHVMTKPFEPQGLVDQVMELLADPKRHP